MSEKVKVDVTASNGELVIREGIALELQEPVKVVLAGSINAPADYADLREDCYSIKKAHVVANYTKRTIELSIDENDYYGAKITGTLDLLPDLEGLKINANKVYTEKELYKKLQFLGRYFKDKEAYSALQLKLQQFNAKVKSEFTNANDYQGTSAVAKIQNIEHDIPLNFVLAMPLFGNTKPVEFRVDIAVDVRNGQIEFWLESVELHELIQRTTEQIFEEELEKLQGHYIVRQW